MIDKLKASLNAVPQNVSSVEEGSLVAKTPADLRKMMEKRVEEEEKRVQKEIISRIQEKEEIKQ